MVRAIRRLKRRVGDLLEPKLAHADDSRRFVKLARGEETFAWGTVIMASAPSMLLLALSRHAVTVAVFEGSIMLGKHQARPGDALITTLEDGMTRRQRFDAQRLAATLPPKWRADVSRSLDAIGGA